MPQLDTVLAGLLVAGAAAYLAWRYWTKRKKPAASCDGDCEHCPFHEATADCDDPRAGHRSAPKGSGLGF